MADVERLELSALKYGERIRVTAGDAPDAFLYEFMVVEPGKLPHCDLTQTNPDGSIVGPARVVLEGTGQWTTPEQNPCQRGDVLAGNPHQEIAMSIGEGLLCLGGYVIVLEATDTNKVTIDRYQLMPEVSRITIGETSSTC